MFYEQERQARRLIGLTSDGEEIYATGTDQSDDDDSSVDDAEKERRRIEMKKHTVYTVGVDVFAPKTINIFI